MSCPFCGTTINPGAIVCTGCQANYRARGFDGFPTFMLGLFVLFPAVGAFGCFSEHSTTGSLVFGTVAGVMLYVFVKYISKKFWFRNMM